MSDQSKPASNRPWYANPPIQALRQEMNDLLENFFGGQIPSLRPDSGPKADVAETSDAVEVTMDLPGFRTDEIQVDVGENYLTVTAEHRQSTVDETDPGRKYHRSERRASKVSRSLWLPCPVEEERVEAQLADGVLTVRLPKIAPASRRRVPVQGAAEPTPRQD